MAIATQSDSGVEPQTRPRLLNGQSVFPPEIVQTTPPGKPAADLAVGRQLGVDGFFAIDFETATSSRASACAVAIASVGAGHVTGVRRWLIRPPGNEYDGFNVALHGITPEMTEDSPTLIDVWPEVAAVAGDQPLVAHYAAFDMSVLRHALAAEDGTWPDLIYYCTRALSRCAWPGMLSYRLVDVAADCGITFAHHDPGADATAAAELAIACCGAVGVSDLADAGRALRVRAGSLSRDGWVPSGVRHRRLADLRPSVDDVPAESHFTDKTVVFTGTLSCGLTRAQAGQLVVDAGGMTTDSMSKKVDYLVLGLQDARKVKDGKHSGKMLKAAELQRTGSQIEFLSEDDFLRMLPA